MTSAACRRRLAYFPDFSFKTLDNKHLGDKRRQAGQIPAHLPNTTELRLFTFRASTPPPRTNRPYHRFVTNSESMGPLNSKTSQLFKLPDVNAGGSSTRITRLDAVQQHNSKSSELKKSERNTRMIATSEPVKRKNFEAEETGKGKPFRLTSERLLEAARNPEVTSIATLQQFVPEFFEGEAKLKRYYQKFGPEIDGIIADRVRSQNTRRSEVNVSPDSTNDQVQSDTGDTPMSARKRTKIDPKSANGRSLGVAEVVELHEGDGDKEIPQSPLLSRDNNPPGVSITMGQSFSNRGSSETIDLDSYPEVGTLRTLTQCPSATAARSVTIKLRSQGWPSTIVCDGPHCARKTFTADDLLRNYGIQLHEAKDEKNKKKSWQCPVCIGGEAANEASNRAAAQALQQGLMAYGSLTKLPKFGNECIDDDILCDFLQQLSGQLINYVATASSKPTLPYARLPLWDNPYIRDEHKSAAVGRVNELTVLLRKLLDVSEGVSISEKVKVCQLGEYPNMLWIKAILVSLFSSFVFGEGSPFEDDSILRRSLVYSGLQSEVIDSITQDLRIRTTKMDPQPEGFSKRLDNRRRSFIQQLNSVMLPIVGSDSTFNSFHTGIADLAINLNVSIWTDAKGEFGEIRPEMCDKFDPHFHVLTDKEQAAHDCTGQPILLTTMVGIKYRQPGRPWRVCVQAKVELLRVPPMPAANPSKQARSKRPPPV